MSGTRLYCYATERIFMSENKLTIPRLTHFEALLKANRCPDHSMLVKEMQKLDIAGSYSIIPFPRQKYVTFLKGENHMSIGYDYRNDALTSSCSNVPRRKDFMFFLLITCKNLNIRTYVYKDNR